MQDDLIEEGKSGILLCLRMPAPHTLLGYPPLPACQGRIQDFHRQGAACARATLFQGHGGGMAEMGASKGCHRCRGRFLLTFFGTTFDEKFR